MPVGASLELWATAHQDALYSTEVRIEDARRNEGGVPLLDLTRIGEWRRSQRRDTVRGEVSIETARADRAPCVSPMSPGLTPG